MDRLLSLAAKMALLQTPLLTPIALGLEKPAETGLAIRTANLFAFRRQGLPVLIRPVSYQGKEGIWMAALAFRITGSHNEFLEGAAYLNPRSAYDVQLLQHLIKQDRVPILLLSPRLRTMISHAAEWTVHQRQDLRVLLTQVTHTRGGGAIFPQEADLEFERARQEFEKSYSIEKLLTHQTAGTVRVSSPFRGVVLG